MTTLDDIIRDVEEVEAKHVGEPMSITSATEHTEMVACHQCSGLLHFKEGKPSSQLEPWPCAAARAAQWLRRIVIERG